MSPTCSLRTLTVLALPGVIRWGFSGRSSAPLHVTAMKNINLRLYLVTDENCMPPGRDLFHAVEEALQAGVTLVQYREKNGLGRSMLEKAIALRRLCHRYNVPLLVNDRLDIALLSGADGVHLGQDDIPVAEARRLADLFAVNNAAACQPDYETVTERASVHIFNF